MDQSVSYSDTTARLGQRQRSGWPAGLATIVAVFVLGFLLLPWSIEGKALAALHGLCAQQPGHSFYFGEQRLPFDARMTGIYGGFAVAVGYLLARGRWRFAGLPSIPILVLLALFVAVLGLDGLNSTLKDLGQPYAYEPHNELRLATGLLTGSSLALFIWLLVAQVGFARSARVARPAVTGTRDLGLLLGAQALFAVVVLGGWSPTRVPLTFLLLLAAVLAVSGLSLAFVLLLGRRECRSRQTLDLAEPATVALLVAFLLIGSLSGGRFLLEAWLDIAPPPTAPTAAQEAR